MNGLSDQLANGSWQLLVSILVFSFFASFNPCMFAMVPLLLGNNQYQGARKVLQFISGFILALVVVGLLSALTGRALGISGRTWSSILGLLYLILGLSILHIKPINLSGFYVARHRFLPKNLLNVQWVNPLISGVTFGLAPSPCTLPAVTAIAAYTLASGKVLFGILALGAFGIGHSVFLALTFIPGFRSRLSSFKCKRNFSPILGIILILLAAYLLLRPDLVGHSLF